MWDEVKDQRLTTASLLREATERLNSNRCLRQERHFHHEVIDERLARQLFLKLPSDLRLEDMPRVAARAFEAFVSAQRAEKVLLREIALSRFLSEAAATSDFERGFRETSSVDFLVYARAPYDLPLVALEYDGLYHRIDDKKAEKDEAKNALLGNAGVPLVRVGSDVAPARPSKYEYEYHEVHPRLPVLLGIVAEISKLHLRNVKSIRSSVEAMGRRCDFVSGSQFGKRFDELQETDQRYVLAEALQYVEENVTDPCEGTGWEVDYYDWVNTTPQQQLDANGFLDVAVEDFCIGDSTKGRWARGRLKTRVGATHSLRTPSIELVAPGLSRDDCTRFVDRHLVRAFVDAAIRRIDDEAHHRKG